MVARDLSYHEADMYWSRCWALSTGSRMVQGSKQGDFSAAICPQPSFAAFVHKLRTYCTAAAVGSVNLLGWKSTGRKVEVGWSQAKLGEWDEVKYANSTASHLIHKMEYTPCSYQNCFYSDFFYQQHGLLTIYWFIGGHKVNSDVFVTLHVYNVGPLGWRCKRNYLLTLLTLLQFKQSQAIIVFLVYWKPPCGGEAIIHKLVALTYAHYPTQYSSFCEEGHIFILSD